MASSEFYVSVGPLLTNCGPVFLNTVDKNIHPLSLIPQWMIHHSGIWGGNTNETKNFACGSNLELMFAPNF